MVYIFSKITVFRSEDDHYLEKAWEEADQGVECWRAESAGRAGAARQTAVPKLIVVAYDQQLAASSASPALPPCRLSSKSLLHIEHICGGMLRKHSLYVGL